MTQLYGFCCDCDKTRGLDVHGRCGNCGSDAIMQRKSKHSPDAETAELKRMYAVERK